jgi:hypothetical protein
MEDARELMGGEHVGERGRRRSKLVNENLSLVGLVRPFGKAEVRLRTKGDDIQYQFWRDVRKANTKPRTPEWEAYVPSSISGLCERGTSVDITDKRHSN